MRLKSRKKTKEKRDMASKIWQSPSRYWMAMGTLVAYSASADLLLAQTLPSDIARGPQSGSTATEHTLPLRRYRIPARPLEGVLLELQKANGLQSHLELPLIVTIQSQGATTLRDVLRYVPGITLSAGEGGATPGDNVNTGVYHNLIRQRAEI